MVLGETWGFVIVHEVGAYTVFSVKLHVSVLSELCEALLMSGNHTVFRVFLREHAMRHVASVLARRSFRLLLYPLL